MTIEVRAEADTEFSEGGGRACFMGLYSAHNNMWDDLGLLIKIFKTISQEKHRFK